MDNFVSVSLSPTGTPSRLLNLNEVRTVTRSNGCLRLSCRSAREWDYYYITKMSKDYERMIKVYNDKIVIKK